MTTPVTTPNPVAQPSGAIRIAAVASWVLPMAALLVVGLSEKAGGLLPATAATLHQLTVGAMVAVGLGLAAGLAALYGGHGLEAGPRRRALAGTIASAAMALVIVVARAAGAASSEETAAELKQATDAALSGAPGWNGGVMIEGTSVFAFEVDASTDLARILVKESDQPYRVVLFGIDNRGGPRDVVVDVGGAKLGHAGGAVSAAVLPSEAIPVAAGERVDGARAFFAPGETLKDVQWIEVRVDGTPRRLRGKYFTLEEKRAIDAARARGPGS